MAEIKGASRLVPPKGRYTTRSIDHPYKPVRIMVSTSVISNDSTMESMPKKLITASTIALMYALTM